MILVLCEHSQRAQVFPTASRIVPSGSCPVCRTNKPGICVLGVKDEDVVCLGSFAAACATVACECGEYPCVHIDPDHPATQPLLERWLDLVEPVEAKQEKARAQVRAQLLNVAPAAWRIGPSISNGQQLLKKLQQYLPGDALVLFQADHEK